MRGYKDKRTKCLKQTNKHRALAKVHAFFLLENSLFWKICWLVFFFFFYLQFLQLFIYMPYDTKGANLWQVYLGPTQMEIVTKCNSLFFMLKALSFSLNKTDVKCFLLLIYNIYLSKNVKWFLSWNWLWGPWTTTLLFSSYILV